MTPFHAFQGVFQSPALQAAAWGMAASFALCVLLVITKRWHGALKNEHLQTEIAQTSADQPKST